MLMKETEAGLLMKRQIMQKRKSTEQRETGRERERWRKREEKLVSRMSERRRSLIIKITGNRRMCVGWGSVEGRMKKLKVNQAKWRK